jgi:hypothetical protein
MRSASGGHEVTAPHLTVMPALVAGIHVFLSCRRQKDVDGRDKPGHDESVSHDLRRRS